MTKKILIVDDNEHVLKLLKISLEKANYEVYQATNGDEGMEKAREVLPDLIISDVMMPMTDGIEFCWMIRENSSFPMVPFIFLTSLEDREMEIRGFRAGADEYLVKPVDRAVLLEKVATLLHRADKVKSMDSGAPEGVKGFEGNLADLSLAEVIQLLNLNQRSGVLHINAAEDGEIVFKKGQMLSGKYGKLKGETAIFKAVPQKKGTFRFEPGEKDVPRNVEGSTMNVLIEALRLDDEKGVGG
ncbi:MAG: response regulator [Calditrichaceae bacterium]|nr:response regulator [Calditrichia bacterium]NUQ44289.1 response regulator [Calditrichaceae bacterium]